MSISDLNLQKVLLDLGYTSSTNKTGVIFANVIDQIFFGFGSSVQNGLINEAKKQNLPKNFKFPYYSLVKKSILDFLGVVDGKRILDELNAEFTRRTNIPGTTEEILSELSKKEVLHQIQKLQIPEYIIYLWKDTISRDKVLTHFLESSKVSKTIISSEKISISGIESRKYSEIFDEGIQLPNKNFEIFDKTYESSYIINFPNLTVSNNNEWVKQGKKKRSQIETVDWTDIGKNQDIVIQAQDITKIRDEKNLKLFLDHQSTVMLDDPFVIYRKDN